jgi:nickel/cobalt exporter
MVLFGLAYFAWGLRRALVSVSGYIPHAHGNHVHIHRHGTGDHDHPANDSVRPRTFWALFVLFVLGPCEPLIPLFVLPASRGRWDVALAMIGVYAVVTVATMLVATTVGLLGARRIAFGAAERYAHAMAGATVAASGLLVISLGL